MARSLIGLDVGTSAVRAAEVRFGRGRPALVRFAQVALPPGAVVAGEVVDATTVGSALKRLWREGGFKSRHVVTGVAGQRVVARSTELAAMSDDDLRSSLPFQVQDLIPIPIDEAVIDHQVLERLPDVDGSERLRVLVVAAHKDVVRALLAALDAGGLIADRVDLISFALVRSLHAADFGELHEDAAAAAAEAVVDIGGGVTNVVVHEHGVPRFIRSLATGGVELTESLVTELDVEFEEAEAIKRHAARGAVGVEAEHARTVLRAALSPVLEEIRTSLEFWQGQTGDEGLRRVVLTGGGAIEDEMIDRLERLVAAPVVRGRAFARVDTEPSNLDVDLLVRAEPVAAVAVGFALSGEPLAAGSRRVSLMPTEIAEQRRERKQVFLAGAAVAAFAALLLGVYTLRSAQVADAEDEAVALETRTGVLQSQIAQLQDVEALQTDIAKRRDTVLAVLDGDIAWGRLVQEVAAVIPNDVWLTGFNGTRGSGVTPGTVTFGGMGFDQTSTANWIIRVSDLDAFRGLWVPSSTKSTGGVRELVTFSSSAQLTPDAQSSRASRYLGTGR